MASHRDPKRLGQFLVYLLGRHPEEFGLVPDADGYVRTKSILAVCAEEPGFAHVRQRDIDALPLVLTPCPVEIDGSRARAVDRSRLAVPMDMAQVPKILWLPIRRRAHARVTEHGSQASAGTPLILAAEQAMAERIGRRQDRNGLLAAVHTAQALATGSSFRHAGGALYITDSISPQAIILPPPPEPEPAHRPAVSKSTPTPRQPAAGSIILDRMPDPAAPHAKKDKKRRKDPDWKRERKHRKRSGEG